LPVPAALAAYSAERQRESARVMQFSRHLGALMMTPGAGGPSQNGRDNPHADFILHNTALVPQFEKA
jgi:hypothetical protein